MKKTKDQVQKEAELAIQENNGFGLIVMATGTGKSKIPIDIIKKNYKKSMKVLIIVPTEKLRDVNWKNEFDKWGCLDIYEKNVERACYVSANKIYDQHYDLVVLDEAHNITEKNHEFFHQNKVDSIIGLTATMPDSELKLSLFRKLNLYIIYKVTLDEAVEWGLVSPYEITVIGVELDKVNKNVVAGNIKKRFMQTEQAAYNYMTKRIENLKSIEDKSVREEQILRMMIFKRLHLIYSLESKTKAAEFLLSNIFTDKERTLIFCGSIKQAERLNPESYHSKSKSAIHFEEFIGEKINRLSCVNSINEGHNIPNLDNALIVQLNSKELNLVQRIGRIIRYRNGHIGKIVIIVAMNTVDAVWTKKSLLNFNQSNIRYIKYSELKKNYLLNE